MPDLNPNTLRLFDEFVLGIKQEPAPGAPEGVAKKAQEGSGTAKRNAEMSDKTRPSRIASGLTEHFKRGGGLAGMPGEAIDVPGESWNPYEGESSSSDYVTRPERLPLINAPGMPSLMDQLKVSAGYEGRTQGLRSTLGELSRQYQGSELDQWLRHLLRKRPAPTPGRPVKLKE